MNHRISVVIVTFNSHRVIRGCLASLSQSLERDDTEVIVVDNTSSDGTRELVRAEFPWVSLVEADTNLGYSGGNNLGVSHSSGDYILLLNPDTLVAPDAIGVLAHALSSDSDRGALGVVGPCILDPDGRVGHAWGDLPTLSWALIDKGPGKRLRIRTNTEVVRHGGRCEDRDVGFVTGACMMTTRETWNRLRGLDEDFFLYFEDVDFCARVRRLGGRVRLVAAARVVHLVGDSFAGDDVDRQLRALQGLILYLSKDRSRIAATVLRSAVLLERAAYLATSYLPGRRFQGFRENREEHLAFMRAVVSKSSSSEAPRV